MLSLHEDYGYFPIENGESLVVKAAFIFHGLKFPQRGKDRHNVGELGARVKIHVTIEKFSERNNYT